MRDKASKKRLKALACALLGAAAAFFLFLAASTLIRSVQTAQVNDTLSRMHGLASAETIPAEDPAAAPRSVPAEVPTAAPRSVPARAAAKVSRMGFPDGSAIPERGEDDSTDAGAKAASFHGIRTDQEMLQEMQVLKQINPDTAGWIHIENVLDLPVVYRDNSWYLNHDFYGKPNAAGTLFLDQSHPVESGTQNLLIHGHNMKDGSMFAPLTHYTSEAFLKQHSLITFSTLWEKETYQVFAVLRVSSRAEDPDYFNYFSHPAFATQKDYTDYIAGLTQRAVRRLDFRADPGKALLTLSTCAGDDRIVIAAQRIF